MIKVSKIIVIGEALIDFIPQEIGIELKSVSGFIKSPGGAPANVAACVSKLGIPSQIITKLGADAFGDFLVEKMQSAGIDTKSVYRTNMANTALAFVSLHLNGEREFTFYRKPSADMLLEACEIKEEWFEKGDILHFCSVDLVDAPVRKAHDEAIRIAKEKELIISFDPNVRLPLWEDKKEYRRVINEYIPKANILKISDDEIEFITGVHNEEEAIALLIEKVDILVYTKGSKGVRIFTKNLHEYHEGYSVKAVDATGAGDSLIGAVLYRLMNEKDKTNLGKEHLQEIIAFANAVAAIVVTRKGAIDAMPTISEVENFMKQGFISI